MNNITVHIEIPKNTRVKYEYKNNKLICDRILHTPITYPFSYGYIENTLGGDGDALDAIVILDEPLISNCYIDCKIIDALVTIDEQGRDEKFICVPTDKIDPISKNINNIKDIDESVIQKIVFFYEHYK